MSKIIFSLKFLSAVFLATYLLLGSWQYVLAQTATLSFSPSKKTAAEGEEFSVTILVNTGVEYVNAVAAYVSYPSDKLEAKSVSTSGSALTIFAEKEITSGLVKIAGGTPTPGFSGSKTITSVRFLAKTSSGSAQIKFAAGSVVLKDSDNSNILNLAGSGVVTITFKSQAVLPPPEKDTKAPSISDIEVKDITRESATIIWKTDEESDAQVEYGFSPGEYSFSLSDPKMTKDHMVLISDLPAGETFYFVASSKDAAGNEAKSSEQTFRLLSLRIQIEFLKDDKASMVDAEVSLYMSSKDVKSGRTDEDGKIIFDNVVPGRTIVTVKYKDFFAADKIEILPDKDFQSFELKFAVPSFSQNWTIFGLAIITLLTFVFTVFLIRLIRILKVRSVKKEEKIDILR